MTDRTNSTSRLPYVAPTLKRYGDLAQLTSVVGNFNRAQPDGGPPNMDKTQ